MKKSTSDKSKTKFAKKRANAKNPTVKAADKDTKKPTPGPTPPPTPPSDVVEVINGPTPEVRPCSPAETQKGHHEVVQS